MREPDWNAIRRMETTAEQMSFAADRVEHAVQRLALMLENGYGGNGERLIELLEAANTSQVSAQGISAPSVGSWLSDLEAILCDTSGNCVIDGSAGDRTVVNSVLAEMRRAMLAASKPAKEPRND